jgi:hypothetical protein
VEHLQSDAPEVAGTDAPHDAPRDAWSLFKNRAQHEREVTLFVHGRLAEAGVHPAALPKD